MKNMVGQKNFMKIAGLLLVTAALICSSTAVTAITQTQKTSTIVNSDRSTVILEEGFEEGIMPPTGWATTVYNPSYTWSIVTDPIHSGTYAAQCPRSNYGQNEWLISPVIDLSYYYSAEITFWANTTLAAAPEMNVDLVVRGDGINDIIWSVTSESEWQTYAWRVKTIDLTAYVGQSINVSWNYYGGAGKKNFGLDDIVVSGVPLTPPPELQIGDIKGGFMKITADITNINNETGDDGFNVTWTANATGNGLFRKFNFTWDGVIPTLVHNGGSERIVLSQVNERNNLPLVGIGMLNITIKVSIPDNPRVVPVEKYADGLLFFFIVI